MYRYLPALAVALACSVPQMAQAYDRLPRPLASLSPDHFAGQVRIADDPHEARVVLSTVDGYARGRSLNGAHANDVHLRALVDRNSGHVTWQVWHELISTQAHKKITAIHYTAGGKPGVVAPVALDHWLDQCPPTDGIGSCNRFTRVGFELPERVVREIAAAYEASSRKPWRLHFQDASGRDVIGGLAPAEAAGLVQALDTWRGRSSAHGAR